MKMQLQTPVGNRTLPRSNCGSIDNTSKVVQKLPRNWYLDGWYVSCRPAEQMILDVGEIVEILSLVSNFTLVYVVINFSCSQYFPLNLNLSCWCDGFGSEHLSDH
jgi:hypothetical protein